MTGREDKYIWTKWYWQDWLADTNLKLSSLAAKGLWIEMLAIMAKSEKKGYLIAKRKQIKSKLLAKLVGEDEDIVENLLNELKENGVYSENKSGVIFCRRMVREAELSEIRSKSGKKGGRPKKQKESKSKAKAKASSVSASVSASSYSRKKSKKDKIFIEIPEWIPLEEFEEYKKMRIKIKKPMTDKAIDLAIKKLETLKSEGDDPKEVLEQSILNSWQGLFPIKKEKKLTYLERKEQERQERRKRFLAKGDGDEQE